MRTGQEEKETQVIDDVANKKGTRSVSRKLGQSTVPRFPKVAKKDLMMKDIRACLYI